MASDYSAPPPAYSSEYMESFRQRYGQQNLHFQPTKKAQTSGVQEVMRLSGRLGFDAAFTVDRPELIVMQEKWSFAGDRFRVKDSQGRELLSMKAQAFSLSNRKEFFAPQSDRLLFTLRRRVFEIPQSFYLETPMGQEILTIEGGWSLGTKFEVHFANALAGGQSVSLQVRGDWIDRNADITWDGLPVARVRRAFANWRELSGRHTYGVEVAPGVDLTLITAIVVAIDEKNRGN